MYSDINEFHIACKKCNKCDLRKTATQVVPGAGNESSSIMFIGEGPGANEDKLGVPFIGAAGRILDELLKSIGITREEVYIANTVKCRPPENRDPTELEKEKCRPWLNEQIRLINPKVFVPLGKHALGLFLPNVMISKAHGKVYKKGSDYIFAAYHPAVALYNGSMKKNLLEDFQILSKFLKGELEETLFENID